MDGVIKIKKGYMKTLEGALSIFVLLAFLFYVIPHTPSEDRISKSTRNFVMLSIKNMDNSGILDEYMAGNTTDLAAIKSALNNTISSNINYTVGISKINSSYGMLYPKEFYNGTNISYIVNITDFRYASLTLNFINATNPRIYTNSIGVFSHDGDYSGLSARLDITSGTIDGENKIEIKTANNATVEYILNINNQQILSPIPEDKAIGVATYILSGKEGNFQPTIIEVYLWK
ncbi:MAG: hypothetical protein ABIG84_01510 [archaeon]